MNEAKRKERRFDAFVQYRQFRIAEAADQVIRFMWENGETVGMDPIKVVSLVDLLSELRGNLMKGETGNDNG